jgi:hypothetical protein
LEQGQVLVKTWSVQNNGAESWPGSSKLIFLRGDRELLGETEEFSVVCAKSGQSVEISVPITTPTKAGNYSAYFQLADADRKVFGPRLWLEVSVSRDEEDERKLGSSSTTPKPFTVSSTVSPVDTTGWVDVNVEVKTGPTHPTRGSAVAPAPTVVHAPIPPVVHAPVSVASAQPIPTITIPVPKAPPAKYAAQLASLATMGFKNQELNAFMLEKHNGDVQAVTNWLLENMNH